MSESVASAAPGAANMINGTSGGREGASALEWWARAGAGGLAVAVPSIAWWVNRNQGLWGDEAFSATLARLPAPELWEVLTRRELNGSAHTLLLSALGLGDSSEAMLRVPSAIAVAVAGFLVFLTLRSAAPLWIAFVGETLFLLSPNVFEAAVTVRFYGLVLMVTALILWIFLHPRPWSTMRALALGVAAGIALYTHFYTGFLVATLFAVAWMTRRNDRRYVLLAGSVFAAMSIPALVFVIASRNEGQLSWLSASTVTSLGRMLSSLLGGGLQALLLLPILVAAIWGVVRSASTAGRAGRELLVLVAAPIITLSLLSFVTPLLTRRYLWFVLPAFLAMIVLGLWLVRDRRWRGLFFAGLAIATVIGIPSSPIHPDETRTAIGEAAALARPGDAVISLIPYGVAELRYYGPRDSRGVLWEHHDSGDAEAVLADGSFDARSCLEPAWESKERVFVIAPVERADELVALAGCSGRDLDTTAFAGATLGILSRMG